jgi:hypothetical protein
MINDTTVHHSVAHGAFWQTQEYSASVATSSADNGLERTYASATGTMTATHGFYLRLSTKHPEYFYALVESSKDTHGA